MARRSDFTRALLVGFGMCGSCGPKEPISSIPSTSSASVSTDVTGDSGESESAAAIPTTSEPLSTGVLATASSDATASSLTGFTETTCNFVCETGANDTCDVFVQDCPSGEKCAPYVSGNAGAQTHDMSKCVPLVDEPHQPGETCELFGDAQLDNCDKGLLCLPVSGATRLCLQMCTGSVESPICPSGYDCLLGGYEVLNGCIPNCHPLDNDCLDKLCVPSPDIAVNGFDCVPDNSGDGGEIYGSCASLDACDVGLICADATASEACDVMASACCLALCDVFSPMCPSPDESCLPFFPPNEAPVGLGNVGFCVI